MTENELCILRNLIIKMSFQEAFLRRAPWHKVPQPENVRTKVCGSDSEANTCPRESKNKTEVKTKKFLRNVADLRTDGVKRVR